MFPLRDVARILNGEDGSAEAKHFLELLTESKEARSAVPATKSRTYLSGVSVGVSVGVGVGVGVNVSISCSALQNRNLLNRCRCSFTFLIP
jgi:hypothetical protein